MTQKPDESAIRGSPRLLSQRQFLSWEREIYLSTKSPLMLHTFVPATPRLAELIAAVPLEGLRLFPVRENATLYEYAWSPILDEIRTEVGNMVWIHVTSAESCVDVFEGRQINDAVGSMILQAPRTISRVARLESGILVTGSEEVAIIIVIKFTKGQKMQIWRNSDAREDTELESGLHLILPNAFYVLPSGVPFYPLFSAVTRTV